MIQERVTFENSKGHTLHGMLRIPTEDGKFPAIIVCHGFLQNKDRVLMFDFANSLSLYRMVTLRFDFTGHGESEGDHHDITLSQMVDDIKSALDFLEKVKQVNVTYIGIVGHELGGMASLLCDDPRIDAIVTVATRTSTEGFIKSRFSPYEIKEWKRDKVYDAHEITLGINFLDDLKNHDDILDSTSRKNHPMLFIHGTNDKRTPYEDARRLFYHAKKPTLELVDGADHNFTDDVQREYIIETAADWLLRTLREQ